MDTAKLRTDEALPIVLSAIPKAYGATVVCTFPERELWLGGSKFLIGVKTFSEKVEPVLHERFGDFETNSGPRGDVRTYSLDKDEPPVDTDPGLLPSWSFLDD